MATFQAAEASESHPRIAELEASGSQVEEVVDKFLHFTGVEPLKYGQRFSLVDSMTKLGHRPNSVFILVMGTTGAGKSSFVSQCTGKEAKVGHDLVSCEYIHWIFVVATCLSIERRVMSFDRYEGPCDFRIAFRRSQRLPNRHARLRRYGTLRC